MSANLKSTTFSGGQSTVLTHWEVVISLPGRLEKKNNKKKSEPFGTWEPVQPTQCRYLKFTNFCTAVYHLLKLLQPEFPSPAL